jgi:stage V sporulation protein B
MGAKAVFIGTGFVVQLLLPRALGNPEEWGRYSTVATITAIVTNTLIAALLQTVSKRTSDDEGSRTRTQREGLWIGAGFAIFFGGGFAAMAPFIASFWQRDATLTPLLIGAAGVIAAYCLYSPLIGSLNGQRQFSKQAMFDMGFALLRGSAILIGAISAAAAGAVFGFASAATIIVVIAAIVIGIGKGPAHPNLREWMAYLVPIAIYQASINGVLQLDQPLLRANLADLALARGDTPEEATAIASSMAGFYRAAQTFAFVPYQLVLSITFVVFPTVARTTTTNDANGTRAAIRGAMRLSLIVLLAMAMPIAGASDGIMRIAYQETYLVGAPALAFLAPGLVSFALFAIGASILAGAGRARTAAGIAVSALILVIITNSAAVRAVGIGDHSIVAAAIATSVASLLALIAVGSVIHRLFGAFLPPLSTLRALLSGGCAWLVAHSLPHQNALGAIGACIAGFLTYFIALVIFKEIGSNDIALLRGVISRRARP